MFKNWDKLFTTTCQVILLDDNNAVYPIFKNGHTSLFNYAEEKNLTILKNGEISELKNIKVFLRDPISRFVAGVHTVIELGRVDHINKFLKNIETFKIYDRHFIPQFYWLIHLFRYFKGDVELLSVDCLYKLIPNREGSSKVKNLDDTRRKEILSIDNKKYIEVDHKLIQKYLGQTINLQTIIKELKNAVS